MNRDNAIKIATDFIADEEDLYEVLPDGRVRAYWDKYGLIWTIGWGNTYYQDGRPVKEGDIISQKQAKDLLNYVVRQKEQAIRNYVTGPVNDNQYAALISLTYNCGEGNFRGSKLLQLINAGATPAEIEDQYKKTCITAKGVYVQGLFNRRSREVNLYWENVKNLVAEYPKTVIFGGLLFFGLMGFIIYRATKTR